MQTPSSTPTPSRGGRNGAFLPPGQATGFILAVLAVMLVGILAYSSVQSTAQTGAAVSRSMESTRSLRLLLSVVKDAETGQRGFLLTGSDPYLEPYDGARNELPGRLESVRTLLSKSPDQMQRLDALEQTINGKMAELAQTIALYKAGDRDRALSMVGSDRGKQAMDRIRAIITDMDDTERAQLDQLRVRAESTAQSSLLLTTGSITVLLFLIGAAALLSSRDYRARELQAWLRAGQMNLALRIQGDPTLERLGETLIDFLATYLGARVGAIYIAQGADGFRRFGGYALPASMQADVLRPGEGLLGQALRENRVLRVADVPEGYLPVSSSLGQGKARELLLAPAAADGRVQAVVELGFLRPIDSADEDLMALVSEAIAVAVRGSKDRSRLEELLEETQRQSEELQAQQEELRVSNEELEEQGTALKLSKARLETQQVELEQTNSQLEEQMQMLEHQKDDLSKAQSAITAKAAELERAYQYKSEFLANMSHELRTPLNSTLILAKLLSDNKGGNLTEQQVKFAQTIFSAGTDLTALINDILDLSKIEAGKVEVNAAPVAVATLVDGVMRNFEPVAQQKGLRLSATVEPGAAVRIDTDAQRVGQVLKNLLSNALKFTDKGEVALRVYAAAPETISFAVRDTGIGIDAQQHDIIFEAFRQADGSTHRKYGGTGLGLSISRDLARLLGGDLTVSSTAGQGSVFTLTLPLVYVQPVGPQVIRPVAVAPVIEPPAVIAAPDFTSRTVAPEPALVAPPPVPAQTLVLDDRNSLTPGARTILVVEDDAAFAAIMRDLAHEMGFQCVVAMAANEGLVAAAHYRPSAIVLDINLPDYSGLGVLDQLKRNPQTRHIPVHVVSVADYMQEALELGAVGYALKPVKREQLVDAFRKMEAKFSQAMRRVLVIEDDARQRESIGHLLANDDVQIVGVASAAEGMEQLRASTYDCLVIDLNLPDLSGYEFLEKMASEEDSPFPPVIVYTGRSLTRDEEQKLRRYSKSIIIKDARSPERLLDEVTLFIHQVEEKLPPERQRLLRAVRDRDSALEGRRIMVVEDDVRNVFALASVLEPKGATLEIARNGREALEALGRATSGQTPPPDLVLMDIMMPEMDGYTAMREIRRREEWKKLPIIALTAKAMKDDQEKCLAAGANDYIAKPLDVEKLLSLVRVWLPK